MCIHAEAAARPCETRLVRAASSGDFTGGRGALVSGDSGGARRQHRGKKESGEPAKFTQHLAAWRGSECSEFSFNSAFPACRCFLRGLGSFGAPAYPK